MNEKVLNVCLIIFYCVLKIVEESNKQFCFLSHTFFPFRLALSSLTLTLFEVREGCFLRGGKGLKLN